MIEDVRAALRRWGGMLVAPRATVAVLPDDEGQRDGWWLVLLWVATSGLVPVIALALAETILGPEKSHRRALVLVPMVALAVVLHDVSLARVVKWPWAGPVLAIAIAAGFAALLRPAVRPRVLPPLDRGAEPS